MAMRFARAALLFCGGLFACAGCGEAPAAAGPAWTQVFATWSCEASGRAPWKFSVMKLGELGEPQQWKDHDTGVPDRAEVGEAGLDLEHQGKSFRTFTYDVAPNGVLEHLTETDGAAMPYACTAEPHSDEPRPSTPPSTRLP